jgi:hypothetical protein
MVTGGPPRSLSVLPHLLALPHGVVVGLAPGLERACPTLPGQLGAFGPCVISASDLRHAVHRAPDRLVVHAGSATPPIVGAALAALTRSGTAVVLRSPDLGQLLEECERILAVVGPELRWVARDELCARRCLMLRTTGAADWLRVPLGAGSGAEGVLARFAAEGLRVCESRIAYEPSGAR